MKKISTSLQAKNAKAGVYSVKGASGFGFKKDSDTPGVGSYTVRYRFNGKRPTMGLGSFSEISMADAREAAIEAVKLARKGVNPIEARRREREANLAAERAKQPITFIQSADTHVEAHAPSWRHKYARATWYNSVKKYAFPILGETPTNDIVAEHVAAVVRSAAADGNLATGKLVQQRIRKILNGAIARGERDPLRGNPADGQLISALVPLRRRTVHFRRIKLDDAPTVFRALREAQGRATGLRGAELDAWLFMIATCARPSEALLARWPEVDLAKRLWVLPPTRMKSEREHIVPLSAAALEVLERRLTTRSGDRVFAGPSGSAVGYTNFALGPKKAGLDAGSPHSWRSLFSDWRGNQTNFPRELAEFALAHAVPGVAGDYQRESAPGRRVELMAAYARWLTGAEADIIAFPARAWP
jgi:integrase